LTRLFKFRVPVDLFIELNLEIEQGTEMHQKGYSVIVFKESLKINSRMAILF